MVKAKEKQVQDEPCKRRTLRNRQLRDKGREVARYLLDNPKGVPQEILDAARVMLPMRRPAGESPRRVDNIKFFQDMFKKRKTITESELYSEFGMTRPIMGSKRASALRQAKTPEERIWISFDKAKGIYRYLGVSATPPEGYEGPLPKE